MKKGELYDEEKKETILFAHVDFYQQVGAVLCYWMHCFDTFCV